MVFLSLACLRGMFLPGMKWRETLHLETSAVESWSLITHCGICLDRAVQGSPTSTMSCGLLSAGTIRAISPLGCCPSEYLWPHAFLLEDGGAISAAFWAPLPSAFQVSLSGVLSKYWPGWTLLISGNQWDDSPRYCSKKTSKEICIYLWLFFHLNKYVSLIQWHCNNRQ